MQYKITKLTPKTGNGPVKATLMAPDGVLTDDVALWDKSWPSVASGASQVGSMLEGDLKTEDKEYNGKVYQNKTLWPIKYPTKSYSAPKAIAQAQERKAEYIAEAQDRKEESIAFFNATNAAIEVCSKLIDFIEDDGKTYAIQQSIIFWRDWFIEEWKKHSTTKAPKHLSGQPPF